MTPSDIAAIESALDLVLPRHYSEFVLDYPAALREARLDMGHRNESPEDSLLFNDTASVIERNRDVREPGLLIANA